MADSNQIFFSPCGPVPSHTVAYQEQCRVFQARID